VREANNISGSHFCERLSRVYLRIRALKETCHERIGAMKYRITPIQLFVARVNNSVTAPGIA